MRRKLFLDSNKIEYKEKRMDYSTKYLSLHNIYENTDNMKKKEGFCGQRALVLPQSIIEILQQGIITRQLYMTDIGYYPSAKGHYRERPKGCPQYILIYCMKGHGWYSLNGIRKEVSGNQYFMLPANTPHTYGTDSNDPWTIYWIHFNGTTAKEFYDNPSIYPQKILPDSNSRINDRNQLFEQIYHCVDMGYSQEHLDFACISLQYYMVSFKFIQLFRFDYEKQQQDEKDMTSVAIHYMKENIEKKIRVQDIAEAMKMSPTAFYEQFHKKTGYTPITYLNNLRIQQACHYLDFSDMKLNQLCCRIGFDDAYYFSRLFSQIMGISPREYRKRKKG